ncbi:nucleoside deaminase [Amycolatopsis sp. NPDC004625]|uniref:nucleoside deaminase n=1 Tax=Amycolatopsis sp. NPDC004625 TaxID=3154670 RepID=UPI0033A88B42
MTTSISVEQDWLGEAVRIAARNVEQGGGPFGALIVKDGDVVATGVNRVTANLDPTAHAEVVAIRAACRALGTFKLDGCVLVSSCEPCPMCLSSALWARVDRILYTADRDDAAKAGFDDRAFYELFDRPRETWAVPVTRLSTKDGFAPFAAWLDKADRTDY